MKENIERHREDTYFDGVHIALQPRFKTSEVSGDEWRFSWRVWLVRKGVMLTELEYGHGSDGTRDLERVLMWVAASLAKQRTDEEVANYHLATDGKCANPGCTKEGVVLYKRIKHGCGHCGHREPCTHSWEHHIRFCMDHAIRGDASLDDSDDNYEQIDGPPVREAMVPPGMVSPAAGPFTVTVDSIEDIPDAVEEIRRHVTGEKDD